MTASSSEAAVKIEKLKKDNYVTWAANIEQVLKLKIYWEAVCAPPGDMEIALNNKEKLRSRSELTAVLQVSSEGDDILRLKEAARIELAALDWARKDEVVLATLHLNVAAIHHATFRVSKTARAAWTALKELFRSRNMACSMDMRRRLATIQKRSDEGMIECINRGTMLRYELGRLGHEQTEGVLLGALLSGLPKTNAMTVELLESGEIPSLRVTTERLMAAEVKRLGMADKAHVIHPVAYAAGAGVRHFVQGTGERLRFHCDRPGHMRRYCPERRLKVDCGGGLAMAVMGSSQAPNWGGASRPAAGGQLGSRLERVAALYGVDHRQRRVASHDGRYLAAAGPGSSAGRAGADV